MHKLIDLCILNATWKHLLAFPHIKIREMLTSTPGALIKDFKW